MTGTNNNDQNETISQFDTNMSLRVYKDEPVTIQEERKKTFDQLLLLGCSNKQAISLSYRLVPRVYLTMEQMKKLGYID